MARVILENVRVDFPIYGVQQRSLRAAIVRRATGSLIHREGRHKERVVVRALREVSLRLEEGDRLGLIGHNGSGKSTLLKVIAGIYEPIVGRRMVEGRVTPLFDMMPGLDPEDNGYENILTSGMLLGMSRNQVESKIPEIEEFCELGEYLSLPVRTYSAGMIMRLGFALVTALEPGVLLMDEGFGTGDLRFTERAAKRMDEFMGRSRIIVLASHSGSRIKSMCNKAALMHEGRLVAVGRVDHIYERYETMAHADAARAAVVAPLPASIASSAIQLAERRDRSGNGIFRFVDACVQTDTASGQQLMGSGTDVAIKISLHNPQPNWLQNVDVAIGIDDSADRRIATLTTNAVAQTIRESPPGRSVVTFELSAFRSPPGAIRCDCSER